MKKKLIGSTQKFTWINSGSIPSSMSLSIYDGDETLVSSTTFISSGNGFYYATQTIPTTPGYYVAEAVAIVDGDLWKNREFFKAVDRSVD